MAKNKTRSSEKAAKQRLRTKANKIKRITKMLEQNPNNEQAKKRLEYWNKQ